VFLLSPAPAWIDFVLESPDGSILDPATPMTVSNVQFVEVNQLAYYRLGLPALPADAAGTHSGQWNALLRIRWKGRGDDRALSYAVANPQLSIPYDVVVHCYSNLVFTAYAKQSSFEPGASVTVYASLKEYEVAVDHRAKVWVDITRPDASVFSIGLSETEPGRFDADFLTTLSGLYTMRVRCIGNTFRGTPFQREQTLSAAVYPGGDRPPQTGGNNSVQFWCDVLHCLLSEKVLAGKLVEKLRVLGIDLNALVRCIGESCRKLSGVGNPRECRDAAIYDQSLVRRLAELIATEVRKGQIG
jgi:hypothetical protein